MKRSCALKHERFENFNLSEIYISLKMKVLFGFALIVGILSLGLCDQSYYQPLPGRLPRVRRTFRSSNTLQFNGRSGLVSPYSSQYLPSGTFTLATPEYPTQYRQRTPRWPSIDNYRQIPLHLSNQNVMSSYRRFRSSVPNISTMEVISDIEAETAEQDQSIEQVGQLRFLGWLFGRPSYSRYPDYSMLENVAGVSHGSRYPSGMYPYPQSPSMVVEDCYESLDPYTHEIIEHCEELPMYH